MLTTEAKGRALDFNRVIGGRPFRGLIHLSLGDDDQVYAVCRDAYNTSGCILYTSTSPRDQRGEGGGAGGWIKK